MAPAVAVVVAMLAECGLCVLALVLLLVQRGNHWRSRWNRWRVAALVP